MKNAECLILIDAQLNVDLSTADLKHIKARLWFYRQETEEMENERIHARRTFRI